MRDSDVERVCEQAALVIRKEAAAPRGLSA
jgi:hypothetical protein